MDYRYYGTARVRSYSIWKSASDVCADLALPVLGALACRSAAFNCWERRMAFGGTSSDRHEGVHSLDSLLPLSCRACELCYSW
eukprot:1844258-Amphidinium_carterae.1